MEHALWDVNKEGRSYNYNYDNDIGEIKIQ